MAKSDKPTNNNCIPIQGRFGIGDLHRLLAAIHEKIITRGCSDLILDFSDCTATFAGPMLAVCAQVTKLRSEGIEFKLVLPNTEVLQRLFRNTNWAYLIDPAAYEPSRFRGFTQVPVTHYKSAADQNKSVNKIMGALLSSLTDLTRGDLAAIEWSINEITDNVLNHSESATGGFVQVTTFTKQKQRVEYAVCDAGIGIPQSLRRAHPEITSDSDALDKAIREGVTRDKTIGQGNGLFGSYEICRISGGYFEVHSGYAHLSQNEKRLDIRHEQVPYTGTLIVSCIDYSDPTVLKSALKFGTKTHTPVDYIETNYESNDGQRIVFLMKSEAESFGSRAAGKPVKIKIRSLATLCPDKKIFIDFSDIPLISSSFADEVLGKLFLEFGPIMFMQRLEIVNTSDTVRSLIDKAIGQRMVTGI